MNRFLAPDEVRLRNLYAQWQRATGDTTTTFEQWRAGVRVVAQPGQPGAPFTKGFWPDTAFKP